MLEMFVLQDSLIPALEICFIVLVQLDDCFKISFKLSN